MCTFHVIYNAAQKWIREDERLIESSYHANTPTTTTSSPTLLQKMKDGILWTLAYIFA